MTSGANRRARGHLGKSYAMSLIIRRLTGLKKEKIELYLVYVMAQLKSMITKHDVAVTQPYLGIFIALMLYIKGAQRYYQECSVYE